MKKKEEKKNQFSYQKKNKVKENIKNLKNNKKNEEKKMVYQSIKYSEYNYLFSL